MRAGLHNFVRNAWLSTAATAIMVVTLTLMLSTFILNKALGDTVDDIAREITVSIYLRDDADEAVVEDLGQALRRSEEVAKVTFVSKADAQQRYLDRNQGDQQLLEAISIVGNAFPASYEVELRDLSNNDSVVALVSDVDYRDLVDKFDQNRLDTVNKIGSAQRFITRTGLAAGAIFAIISILVIFNTIRMTIFTRSDEIKIMRLIGATNGYIRGPFLFEAMLYGIVAAAVALTVTYTALLALGPKVNRHVYFDPTIELVSHNWPLVVMATTLVGIAIGIVSSSLAMARYMKK